MKKHSQEQITKITKQVISEMKRQEKIEKIARMVLEELKKEETFKSLVSSIEKEAGIFDKLKKFISTVGIAALLSGGSSDAQAKAQDVVDLIHEMEQEYSKKFNNDPDISFFITNSKKIKEDGRYDYKIKVGPYILVGDFSSLANSYAAPTTSIVSDSEEKTPEIIQKYQPLVKDIKKVLDTAGKALIKKNIEKPQKREKLTFWWNTLDDEIDRLNDVKKMERILDLPQNEAKKEFKKLFEEFSDRVLSSLGEQKEKMEKEPSGKIALKELRKLIENKFEKIEKKINSGEINKKTISEEISMLKKELSKTKEIFEDMIEDESLRITPYEGIAYKH